MDAKELKDTIILPKTNFSIRRKPEKDKEIIKNWEELEIYKKAISNGRNGSFIIHDGPPYSNGPFHIGHFVNKVLKDFTLRFYNSIGYSTPFIPGWDTHGLPIEFKVLSENKKRDSLSKKEIREMCKEYALSQIKVQKNQLKKVGLLADLEKYYSTQDFKYQANELRCLAEISRKKLIYRGLKPVYWSWSNKTALAENEVEYIEKIDHSLFFKVKSSKEFFGFQNINFLVWTTQPWTIPFNKLLAIEREQNYFLVIFKNENLVISENFFNSEFLKIENSEKMVRKVFKGKEIIGIEYQNPYLKNEISKIVDGSNIVSASEGTGILHVAPSCGPEDFELAKKESVKTHYSLDENGKIEENFFIEDLRGVFYQDVNSWVIKDLSEREQVFRCSEFSHSYPHDWRDKTPLVYRLTEQWFIKLNSLKNKIKDKIEKVSWEPEHSKQNMLSFIEKRDDWCISRQRTWGLPIPSIIINNRNKIIPEVVEYVADIVEKRGSEFWFSKDCRKILQTKFSSILDNDNFEVGNETLDVWFDSGVSSFSVLKENQWPADLFLEGKDQFRGWFNSSLILSVILKDQPPYKKVVSHGFTVDKFGKKMSKSLGNAIDINLIIENFGTDIARLWVSSFDFSKEIKVSEDSFLKVKESYQKIRNTLRFIVGNLNSSAQYFSCNKIDKSLTSDLNKYILSKTWNLALQSKENFFNFKFSDTYSLLNNFFNNQLSSFYFEIIKDSLYCDKVDEPRRIEIIMTIYSILKTVLKVISPLVPIISEEVYKNVDLKIDSFFDHDSVHLLNFPSFFNLWESIELRSSELKFEKYLIPLRKEVFRKIEAFRKEKILENSSCAKVTVTIQDLEKLKYLQSIQDLNSIFVVSEIYFEQGEEFLIKVEKSNNKKCQRCWRFDKLKDDIKFLCERCSNFIKFNK